MKPPSFARPIADLFLCAIALSLAIGCSDEPPTGSVSGTVTLNDQPLGSGIVILLDEQTGVGGSAELDASGRYKIASIRVGTYQVAVQGPPPPAPHEMADATVPPAPPIPPKFQSAETSGLSVEVEEGKNAADFAL